MPIDNSNPSTKPIVCTQNLDLILETAGKSVHILKEISLNIESGTKVAIIGPSGSGKTSLLTVMAGLQRPTAGTIEVSGLSLTTANEDQLADFRRKTIGMVFQGFHLLQTMTAFENVAISLELSGEEDSKQRATEALASVGLENRTNHYPHQLSGGEQQRVAIARAFVSQPKLLLADEPTGNLDSENSVQIVDLLLRKSDELRTTTVFVTHDHSMLNRFDRTLHLRDGKIVPQE